MENMKRGRRRLSRLSACGWNSFRPELFFNDAGRKLRDVGDDFLPIIKEFCAGTRILELCSGGGKLLIKLARAGFEVTGIDLSKDMLDICRRIVKKENKAVQDRIRLLQDDMCSFDLGEEFDFIILEDDSFVYLLTTEDQISLLKRVHAHLSDKGFFFLCFATPQRELNSSRPFEYDQIRQIKAQPCEWTLVDESGKVHIVKEGTERRRLTYPCELELLLMMSGLVPASRWGDLQKSPFVDAVRQEYHYLIRKHE
jgi:SAM-dependent methyltransferase